MRSGILYVVHGSRIPAQNAAMYQLLEKLREQITRVTWQEMAFLEGEERTIERQASQLIEAGCEELIVLPVMLFAGVHIRRDIPQQLAAVQTRFPEVAVRIEQPLGTTQAVYELLRNRLETALTQYSTQQVFLIAHGTSRYEEPQEQLTVIAQRLSQQLQVQVSPVSYLGTPNYQDAIPASQGGFIAIPFFLTKGQLTQRIVDKVAVLAAGRPNYVTDCINDPTVLIDAVKERIAAR